MLEASEKFLETIHSIKQHISELPQVAITLGSGLGDFIHKLENPTKLSYNDIPYFKNTSVVGHPGHLVFGKLGAVRVAVLQGRCHYYEGLTPFDVVYPLRTLVQLGASYVILTNASGGFHPKTPLGSFMIIEDHINLTGVNPLRGPNNPKWGERFPDMTKAYNPKLNECLKTVFKQHEVPFSTGVYCGVAGPSYETAAEIQFLKTIGGDAVGMSTVLEVIAAHHMGAKICAVACITNLATGLSSEALKHSHIKDKAQKFNKPFSEALKSFVAQITSVC